MFEIDLGELCLQVLFKLEVMKKQIEMNKTLIL